MTLLRGGQTRSWHIDVITAALAGEPCPGPGVIAEAIGRAVGCDACVLWESIATGTAEGAAESIVAAWHAPGQDLSLDLAGTPDETTRAALRNRSLELAAARPAGEVTVVAALPVTYLDGSAGALTILDSRPLDAEGFDVLADLVEVIPVLCSVMRERQALALGQTCTRILDVADRESPELPLERSRLSYFLTELCTAIAEALQCNEVDLFLRDLLHGDDYSLLATSSRQGVAVASVRSGQGWAGKAMAERRSFAVPKLPAQVSASEQAAGPDSAASPPDLGGMGSDTLMVTPIMTGDHMWGVIQCSGTHAPPFLFTRSDLMLIAPIAAQVAQFWSNWNNRRLLVTENESWRNLAEGVTALNRLIHAELNRSSPREEAAYRSAAEVIMRVVPESSGARVDYVDPKAARGQGQHVTLRAAWTWASASTGRSEDRGLQGVAEPAADCRPSPAAGRVHSTREQVCITDPAQLEGEPLPDVRSTRWLVATPMGVSGPGGQCYGVLHAFGASSSLPVNAPQVCAIMADQLGLFHHLRRTLVELRDTRQDLRRTMRGQAEALEDLEHQLVSPLLGATVRTEKVLRVGRFDTRTESQLRAVRGLCRKASRVALSAGVFATLSKDQLPRPRNELLGSDDLLRTLIAAADDAQQLVNPRRGLRFEVERDGVRSMGRRLISVDRSFLEQCLGNLVDNAAKYSFDSSQVGIAGVDRGDRFSIAVDNVGLTIRPEDVDRCRERNWRGPSARNATGEGSGLGLWIVDHLVRSMSGELIITVDGDRTKAELAFPYT